MRNRLFLSVFLTFFFVLVEASSAANVTSINPQTMVSALHGAGYKASAGKTDDGDPLVDTASGGNDIRIVMTNCDKHEACTSSEFIGVWLCKNSVKECLSAANEINNEESPVKVLVPESGETYVTYMYLFYDTVGISEKLFIRNLEIFSFYNQKFSTVVSLK